MSPSTIGRTAMALAALLALAACGEKPQTAGRRKGDVPAYSGPSTPYTAGSWKAGDEAGWDAQMRQRSQGQNEYSRAPS